MTGRACFLIETSNSMEVIAWMPLKKGWKIVRILPFFDIFKTILVSLEIDSQKSQNL